MAMKGLHFNEYKTTANHEGGEKGGPAMFPL